MQPSTSVSLAKLRVCLPVLSASFYECWHVPSEQLGKHNVIITGRNDGVKKQNKNS